MSGPADDEILEFLGDAGKRPEALDASPGLFGGFGGGAAQGAARGLAAGYYMLGAAGAVAEDAVRGGTDATDWHFRNMESALDYWTPDPVTTGAAGQVTGSLLAQVTPLLLSRGNPSMAAFGTTVAATSETGFDLVRKGVPADTALGVTATLGAANLLGFKIPSVGSNLFTRVATGATGNAALELPTSYVVGDTLAGAGFDELAQQYGLTPESGALAIGMGAAFGAFDHVTAPKVTRPQRDALLVANNAEHLAAGTLPGEPRDAAAAMNHQAAAELALRQLLADEPVDVAGKVELEQFALRPELRPDVEIENYDAFRVALESGGVADAAAPTSGAFGVDQFIPSTWRAVVARAQPAWAQGLSDAELLAARGDPEKSAEMERVLRRENAATLERAGVPVDALNLYAAHHFGGAKGVAFARAADDTPMAEILTPAQMKANPYLEGKTKGQAIENWRARARRAGVMLADELDAPNFGLPEAPRTIDDADPFWQAIPVGERGPDTGKIDTPEREAMRDGWVAEHFVDAQARVLGDGERPIAYVMGGGGASGKGTILKALQAAGAVPHRGPVHIDPDAIKTGEGGLSGIPEYRQMLERGDGRAAAVVHEESSAVAQRVREQAVAGRYDLILDRTLGDPVKGARELQALRDAGYEVRLFGVTIDPATAVQRAVKRAQRSGRFVPLGELLKAHKGFAGAFEDYARQVDEAYLYDNSGEAPTLLAESPGGKRALQVVDPDGYNQLATRRSINEAATSYRSLQAAAAGPGQPARADDPGSLAEGDQGPGSRADRGGGQERPRAGDRGARAAQGDDRLDPAEFPAQGADSTVVTERGLQLRVRWAVVDVADLVTSHDDALNPNPEFPAELQPRDRARAASEQQIARIANAINPELLAESPKAADGAPIVGRDKVVESGNARTIALRRAYGNGKADDYRAFVVAEAERFGLDPAELEGIAQPALVRVALDEYDRAEFARQANESTVAVMSVTEQAMADARRLPDMGNLATGDDGTINMRASAQFVAGFLRDVVGPNERGSMSTADGQLSQQGQSRIRNAVFARAYGDADLVAAMAEATDSNVKNVLAGMLRAAPAIARLREMIAEGGRYGPDVTPDLVAAARKFAQLRSEGMTVEQFEAQGDFFGGGGLTPRGREMLRVIGENARAPKRMAEFLQNYVTAVDALGDPRQADLMGGTGQDAAAAVSTASAVTSAANDAPPPRQGAGLFNAAGRPTEAARAPKRVKAYHASRARFDAFDRGKAGTGSGLSNYGAGIYLVGDRAQGDSYRRGMGEGASLYEVEIPDADRLLDYAAPLAKQPRPILEALERDPFYRSLSADERTTLTGQGYYNALVPGSSVVAGDRAAAPALADEGAVSDYLAELGIVGATYARNQPALEAGEVQWRAMPEFVIFDPGAIERPKPIVTPENRAAYEAIAANPGLEVMGEDGTLRSAADFLAEAEAEAAQVAETERAIEAAANCFVRTAA